MKELDSMSMEREEFKAKQVVERDNYLQLILKSNARKKIIVAGPGTGKTYMFGKVLELNKDGKNIAMTFIRKLAEDMDLSLGRLAEVKTFHAYCKKILHEQNGRVDLFPYLSQIIKKDAEVLDEDVSDFDAKFQNLEERSPEIAFYLQRGDYYEVVSFNDSVYRLYNQLKENNDILSGFDQILIDEFQDFNALEVAFIKELERKDPIIIVGDDDQAIFDDRFASPEYLRDKFKSSEYEPFTLPFCIRCPEAIVNATNSIIKVAEERGTLHGRIPKRFECYLADKEADSLKYPKIIIARCTNAKAVTNYIKKAIGKIDEKDITESWVEGEEYSTVLIVGPKQYLIKIEKELKDEYTNLKYTKPAEVEYGVVEGYERLIITPDSNLGWRILAEFFLRGAEFTTILNASLDGTPIVELLDKEFLQKHRRSLDIIRVLRTEGELSEELRLELKKLVGDHSKEIIDRFSPIKEEGVEIDKTQPSIILTSFKGCKGLSAGHVFIVGANNGSIPVDSTNLKDLEISKFIVALTRTRKQCHIISNKWLYSPKTANGNWIPPTERTIFLDFIHSDLIEDLGELNAEAIKAL